MRFLIFQKHEKVEPEVVANLFRELALSKVQLESNLDIVTKCGQDVEDLERELVAVMPTIVYIQELDLYLKSDEIVWKIQKRQNIFPAKVLVYCPGLNKMVERIK